MLDPRMVLDNPEQVAASLRRRGTAAEEALSPFLRAEQRRRELQGQLDGLRQRRNQANEVMRRADKQGAEFQRLREELRALSEEIKRGEEEFAETTGRRDDLLLGVPNLPHASVPDGSEAEANLEVARFGEAPALSFPPRQHFEIGEVLGLLDFERAAKVAGSRFAFLLGDAARLEMALVQLMLDLHRERGYLEVIPPYLVLRHSMVGTGQLPKFEADAFKTAGDEHFLIPTAEVPVTNLHRDEILDASRLPLRYCAFSPCFRSEAGSYGKDTRGLIRQHQFHKVELVKFVRPETSYDELEGLRADAEEVLRRLGLHYRVVVLCAGDLGFSAAKCYDLEVWLPGQGAFREISSCSNFEDFQARRAHIRYREEGGGKPRHLHTLNGSALAVGRTLVAIMEQYQEEDGRVRIPEALRPYMGGLTHLAPRQVVR